MENTVEKVTTETLSDIVARVAGAMETAIMEHGEGAVDLALLAYQVSAIKSLLLPTIVFIFLMIILYFGFKKFWVISATWVTKNYDGSTDPFGMVVRRSIVGVLLFFVLTVTVTKMLSPVEWIAAFGYPELLIATRALEAAGLM